MKFFSKKEKDVDGLIGIDFGAGGIKAVEIIANSSRLALLTYGYSSQKLNFAKSENLLDDQKKSAEILKEIVKKSGMKSKNANASLPSQHVFHAVVTIPRPSDAKEDIKILIEAQIQKLLPMPLGDMIIDSTIIDNLLLSDEEKTKGSGTGPLQKIENIQNKHIKVLVSGAPKKLVSSYVEMCKLAGVNLISLETESFALIRSLIGKDKARIMIVDIGFERTNVTIVDSGIPYLHRSIKAGGANITAMLAKQMGILPDQAEQVKLDLAGDKISVDIPPVLQEAMMPILHEIKYALELYAQQDFHSNSTVEKIILTGGSAQLPQIDPFLTKMLNINVYIGNPWARIATPEGMQALLAEIGPKFSVAVGLAMKLAKEKPIK